MNNDFSSILQGLVAISPRRGIGEQKACKLLISCLEEKHIRFEKQTFTTRIPVIKSANLLVDKKEIPCIGASFVSGAFSLESPILNAFGAKSDQPSITFNPVSKGICLQGYKTFPSIAVNRDSIVNLLMANEISGTVSVTEEEFESTNILVGNLTNPNKVIFAHYDSIVGSGAIDNAGSVDVLMQTIIDDAKSLEENLFVFAGSEEESFSSHEGYYGFEVFDRKYGDLLNKAEQILVLDGVGIGTPSFVSTHVDWVFAISRIDQLSHKMLWMQNDQTLVMQYYHSELDTIDKLDSKYLQEAKVLLLKELN